MSDNITHENFTETNLVWSWVYDNESETYEFKQVVVNHMIGGDTDSGMFTLQDVVSDDISDDDFVKIADSIGSNVNDSFPDFVMRAFNAPENRKHTVLTDREIVSDISFFLTKKRYCMHVINDEGKPVDKLKIMGLETKKSDTPKFTKDILMEMLRYFIGERSEKDVQALVKKRKLEYPNTPIANIARPISVKGLAKYTNIYAQTGSMHGFPYNIRAAMFYNSLCGPEDRKIVPGDKIGIVYINHPDTKYIGFPLDYPIPKFVQEMEIDYTTQWEKVQAKIDAYIAANGWDFKSKKEKARSALFGGW